MAWAAIIPAALSVAGTATSVAGKMKGGQASSQAASYRAQAARNMAVAYDQAAERVVQGGVVKSDVEGLRTAAAVGDTKAKQAASGVDVNTGSAVDVRAGVAQAGRLNQLTTLNNDQLSAYGYRVKAHEARTQAVLDEAEGSQAQTGAAYGAAGSLISGASALPFRWLTGGSDKSTPAGTVDSTVLGGAGDGALLNNSGAF
jgi:hypothetical protein